MPWIEAQLDTRLDAYRQTYQGAVINQWRPPDPVPGCTVTIEQAWYGACVRIYDAYFPEETIRSAIVATSQHLQHDGQRAAMELQVSQHLQRQIEGHIAEMTQTMSGFREALDNPITAPYMQHFQHYLAQFAYERRDRAAAWRANIGPNTERYEEYVRLGPQTWAEAARRWNEFVNQQATWSSGVTNVTANVTAWGASMTNMTNSSAYTSANIQAWTQTWASCYANTNVTAGTNPNAWRRHYQAANDATLSPPCMCVLGGDTCAHCLARARTDELQRKRQEKRARERQLAERRGRKLLLSLLDEDQLREYASTKTFRVPLADGRVFRLRKGKTAELLNEQGQASASYCIHLMAGTHESEYIKYVDEDTMIAQMLLLQSDPAEFERIANITLLTPSPRREQPYAAWRARARAQRHLAEHDREAEAILRSEGIANPREWVAGLRQQARERYRAGDQWRPVEPTTQRQEIAHAVIEDEMHQIDSLADQVQAA